MATLDPERIARMTLDPCTIDSTTGLEAQYLALARFLLARPASSDYII